MYRRMDPDRAEPARLFRTPEEIREEIEEIGERIEQTESMFSVRQMLLDLVTDRNLEGEDWVDAVESLMLGARKALDSLTRLKNSLEDLEIELEETECFLRN